MRQKLSRRDRLFLAGVFVVTGLLAYLAARYGGLVSTTAG